MKKGWLIALLFGLGACDEQTETSRHNDAAAAIQAPAELISLQQASISAPNIGNLWQFKIEYLAPENTQVKEGDLLVRFDSETLTERLQAKQNELLAARKEQEKNDLDNLAKQQDLTLAQAEAQMNFERAERKLAIIDASTSVIEQEKQRLDHAIAEQKLAQAKRKLGGHAHAVEISQASAAAKVKALAAEVTQLEADIQALSVKAPKSGLVVYKPDWQGNKPAVGETINLGNVLITLPSLDSLALKAEFDEAHSPQVQLQRPVKITLDAHPELRFSGSISRLGQAYRAKSRNNRKVVFDAWVTLDSPDLAVMRPGMQASVELESE